VESQFAALLRRHRVAAGLTQNELAALAGVSVQAISTLERGTRRYPQVSTVSALADALHLGEDQRAALQAAGSRRGRTSIAKKQPDAAPAAAAASPRQLPFTSGDFTGRVQELDELSKHLTSARGVSVTSITGMGGIGKTTLALHVAHQVADCFPDGQLYLDLRGFGLGPPLEPLDALTYLLEDLGETPPADLPTAAARLRTALAAKRLVLLLDNASNHEQVQQLLPGTGGCAVLVTSRRSMATLGGHQFHLGEPPLHESIEMLRQISGRPDAPEAECAEVVRQCGGLPLAIRMAGARLASRPSWPVAHLADRLADGRRRLDELQLDDSGVRATLVLSIEQLAGSDDPVDAQAVSMFALLGVTDCLELTSPLAAALSGSPEPEAVRVLERLVDVHLLTTPGPGRYLLHDLVRVAAREFAEQVLTEADRLAATTRWVRRSSAVAWKASEYVGHGMTRGRWLDKEWLEGVDDLPGQDDVMAWLDSERPNLIPTIQQAVAEQPELAVQLALGLNAYYTVRRAWLECLQANEAVLRLVTSGPDLVAEGLVLHDLGAAHAELGQHEQAVPPLQRASDVLHDSLELYRKAGAAIQQAEVLSELGKLCLAQGRYDQAVVYQSEGLAIAGQYGDWLCEADIRKNLGEIRKAQGLLPEARREWRLALSIREQHNAHGAAELRTLLGSA